MQIEKSIDGVLGIRTQGNRMVGIEETTELWRRPDIKNVLHYWSPDLRYHDNTKQDILLFN